VTWKLDPTQTPISSFTSSADEVRGRVRDTCLPYVTGYLAPSDTRYATNRPTDTRQPALSTGPDSPSYRRRRCRCRCRCLSCPPAAAAPAMTEIVMSQTPPILHGPSDKERKYDRQLRLWAASGQAALESANILLVNSGAGTVGIETIKNLVLPGWFICRPPSLPRTATQFLTSPPRPRRHWPLRHLRREPSRRGRPGRQLLLGRQQSWQAQVPVRHGALARIEPRGPGHVLSKRPSKPASCSRAPRLRSLCVELTDARRS